jgi:hypothetical protein
MVVAFWGGYRSGAVREAVTLVAIFVGWLVAGSLAAGGASVIHRHFGLPPASAHLASFWLIFLLAFAVTRVAGWAAERTVYTPLTKTVSGIGGGLVACVKAALILWLILFIALFFPLAPDVRTALRASPTARWIEAVDAPAYGLIIQALPGRTRPVGRFILKRHHL